MNWLNAHKVHKLSKIYQRSHQHFDTTHGSCTSPCLHEILSFSCDRTGRGEIGDEGCKALAEGLKINQALTSINLSSTRRCLHGHTQLPVY
eukprot:1783604-Pleurochrysis_carterae.AAC.1